MNAPHPIGRAMDDAAQWFATLCLLAVPVGDALSSPADGPSATPMLLAGLLLMATMLLMLLSAVHALQWAAAARRGLGARVALVAAVLPGGAALLMLMAHAADPNRPTASRRLALGAYVAGVIAIHVLNRQAVRRWRAGAWR